MNSQKLAKTLSDLLREVQMGSGFDCPPLSGATKPLQDLPDFDSLVWPVVATMLAVKTGIAIPEGENIFLDESTNAPRSVDEIAALIADLDDTSVVTDSEHHG